MIKTREDSRIEVWSDQYINNPTHRKDEDRDVAIIQMEYVESGNFIVEIIPKNNITQMVPLKEIICNIKEEIDNSFWDSYKTKEGTSIKIDVCHVEEWFNEYKEILRKRYLGDNNKQERNGKHDH